jgi:hypothetical protein
MSSFKCPLFVAMHTNAGSWHGPRCNHDLTHRYMSAALWWTVCICRYVCVVYTGLSTATVVNNIWPALNKAFFWWYITPYINITERNILFMSRPYLTFPTLSLVIFYIRTIHTYAKVIFIRHNFSWNVTDTEYKLHNTRSLQWNSTCKHMPLNQSLGNYVLYYVIFT